ncbi:MAG TPA: phytanoyl-CoA dioxygenase family protein [Allosphingosinicella sp.]|nr:phytanoyl-CoA dioxygenase family protein [Allosphingosinicella sp.]
MRTGSDDGDYVARYRGDGYAVVRGLFSRDEVEAIAAAADQVHDEGIRHGRGFRHGNLFYNVAEDESGAPQVRMVQWPSYHQPVLNGVRLDPRMAALLAPLLGPDLKQIINQIHWKGPGGGSEFAWHQDAQFREPAEAFRNLAGSYVQTGLALDPHRTESGCMRFIPGSHLNGDLRLEPPREVLGIALNDAVLEAAGLSVENVVEVALDPGDVALWSPFLVHGSGINRSDHQRRLYVNGYVRAGDCDRGEWAFKDGRPVPFGPEPALVHYEALRERGEPHYV